jgi:hypothetical protein
VIGATYDQRLFAGDYQGVIAGVRVARGRFAGAVSVPAYRLSKNGLAATGIGDVLVHVHARAIARGDVSAGAMAMVMLPTGDGEAGFGMGHVMLMPELWGSLARGRATLFASAGLGYAIGGNAHAEHGGGMWPIVDPMNAIEVTYGATAMVSVAPTLAIGVRGVGGVPVGDGDHRLAAGVRVAWRAGRVETSAEMLAGVLGDPYGIRGVVEVAVRFR